MAVENAKKYSFDFISQSGRNHSLFIKTPVGGYYYKEPRLEGTALTSQVWREGAFYKLCTTANTFTSLRPHLPKLIHFDNEHGRLVTEAVYPSQTLQDAISKRTLSDSEMPALGLLLQIIHATTAKMDDHKRIDTARVWIVNALAHPDRNELPEANSRSIVNSARQSESLVAAARRIEAFWQPDQLIHADVRFSNFILPSNRKTLVAIDWELAGWGDVHWDIGCALAHLLLEFDLGSKPQTAAIPLFRLLLNAYQKNAPKPPSANKIVNCAALRLTQAACEFAQTYPNLVDRATALVDEAARLASEPKILARQFSGA